MENRMTLISIIVPVYNTGQYLDRCIKSIVDQTFKNLEIILVDDGSTDNSGEICDAWAAKDNRIRVMHKKNEGVTIARKTGVENATGEWINFVDSDDELPEKSIQLLLMSLKDDVDIVCGSIEYIGPRNLRYNYLPEELDALRYTKGLLKNKIACAPFAQLIRKTLFDAFTFNISATITHGEDLIMNLRLGQKARQVILLHDVVYRYIWRPGSAIAKNPMHNSNYRRIYREELDLSILPKNQKKLKKEIACFWRIRYWWILKGMMKKILQTRFQLKKLT